MSTAPQPPVPPAAPVPPRSSSNLLAIVLLSVALIIVACALAVWVGLRFIAHNVQVHMSQDSGEQKEVSIKTPFGGIEVNKAKDVSEAALGLPIYPGSSRIKDSDSASVNIGLPDDQSVRILAAKFRTADSLEKVKNFYHDRLSSQVTKYREKDDEGKTVFEIKRGDIEKVVALKTEDDGTRIELVCVGEGRQEGN
jgi:hypothetical protein